ncbi:MAG: aminotransferase class IV [Gemmatimonadota bacterium]
MNADRVWIAGRVTGRDEARVSIDDRALRYGDGVFATLALRDGVLLEAERHLARLAKGCDRLGLRLPVEIAAARDLISILARLGISGEEDRVVRVQVGAGAAGRRGWGRPDEAPPLLLVETFAPPEPRALQVAVAGAGERLPVPALPDVKTCSGIAHVIAAGAAARHGADDVLRHADGVLTETSAANVFWLDGDRLRTPSADLPLYPGLTRETVIRVAKEGDLDVEEGAWAPAAIRDARAAFLTNAVRGLGRVERLDGRPLEWPPCLAELERAVERRRKELGTPLSRASSPLPSGGGRPA